MKGKWISLLTTATVVASLALAGCSGDDGKDGAAGQAGTPGAEGPPGPEGPPGTGFEPIGDATGALSGGITAVELDTTASAHLTVTFEVTDAAGMPVTGLTSFSFTVAKLVTPTGEHPYWQSYINRAAPASRPVRTLWATGESGTPTEIEPGVYQYAILADLEAAKDAEFPDITSPAGLEILANLDLEFDPSLPHRLGVASTASGVRFNTVMDFVPADLPALLPNLVNQVVTNESCGSCHGNSADRSSLAFPNLHGNARFDVNYCVTCHNPNFYDSRASTADEWVDLDLVTMVHKLHAAVEGYSAAGRDYSHLHYPQPVSNCLTCHDNQRMSQVEGRDAADAVAYKNRPAIESCNTCHDVDFSVHFGNQTDSSNCILCHADGGLMPADVAHANAYSTPNNPLIVTGSAVFVYEIASLTVDELDQPIVKFRVLADGEPVDLANLAGSGITAMSGMSFKIAWSAPQPMPALTEDGPAVAAPVDFNNLGTSTGRQYWDFDVNTGLRSWDQPLSVSLANAADDVVGPDAEGFYTTAPGIDAQAPVAFPADSEGLLRAVALEGYFGMAAGNISGNAVVGYVGTPRRSVVDIENCNTCHEGLGFHSNASRRNNPDHCVMCHNTETSSSNLFAGILPDGFTYTGKDFRQLPNNLKDMIHGLHAGKPAGASAGIRNVPFNFIRGTPAGGSGQGPHAFDGVGYPAALSDCQTCHKPDSYSLPLPEGALWTVVDAEPALTADAPHNVELAKRLAPASAACSGCHDSASATAHFDLNTSYGIGFESCAVCHGPGKIADLEAAHSK